MRVMQMDSNMTSFVIRDGVVPMAIMIAEKCADMLLQDAGIKVVTPTPRSVQELEIHRDNIVRKTVGKAYSKEIYDQAIQILNEFRQTAEKKG